MMAMARWQLGPVRFKIPIHFVERINIFQAKCLIISYDSSMDSSCKCIIHIRFVTKLVVLIKFLQLRKNRFLSQGMQNPTNHVGLFRAKNWIVENWNGKLDFDFSSSSTKLQCESCERSEKQSRLLLLFYPSHLSCRNCKGRSPREVNNTRWFF